MRVLLTGGGTAGHINPALAIAETIKHHQPDAVIEFVGVKGKREEDLVPREGYRLHFVESRGLVGKLPTPSNIKALYLALTSPSSKETQKILDDFKPDLVIGTGGYASWPIMAAAAKRGIPTAVHESNARPGRTVRRLAPKVDRIWTNFPSTVRYLHHKKKVLHVGNPLRAAFSAYDRETARRELGLPPDRKLILSYGGSLGADSINRGAIDMMKDYTSKDPSLLHIHSAGKAGIKKTLQAYRDAGLEKSNNCIVYDYIYDMPRHMAAADLVICRSGAMSVSELALLQKTCILVPYPDAAYNHQYLNAKELADSGAAVLLPDDAVSRKGELIAAAKALLEGTEKANIMQKQIAAFADPDANQRIWQDIQVLLEKK